MEMRSRHENFIYDAVYSWIKDMRKRGYAKFREMFRVLQGETSDDWCPRSRISIVSEIFLEEFLNNASYDKPGVFLN
ncbi:MAG: hypothetical protein QXZ66_00150 [Thermoproteota archaeon]